MGAAHAREGSRCSTQRKRAARNTWLEPVHHDLDDEMPRLSFWRSIERQFTCLPSGLARGRVPQVPAARSFLRTSSQVGVPLPAHQAGLTTLDVISHILHHTKSLSPPSPSPGQSPTAPAKHPGRAASCQEPTPPWLRTCGVAMWEPWQQNPNRIPMEPQRIPSGTCGGWGGNSPAEQWEEESQQHPGTLGTKRVSQAPSSQWVSAWALWLGVSWIFLPKEVSLFWNTCAGFDGVQSFFCGYRMLLYNLSPMYPRWNQIWCSHFLVSLSCGRWKPNPWWKNPHCMVVRKEGGGGSYRVSQGPLFPCSKQG